MTGNRRENVERFREQSEETNGERGLERTAEKKCGEQKRIGVVKGTMTKTEEGD